MKIKIKETVEYELSTKELNLNDEDFKNLSELEIEDMILDRFYRINNPFIYTIDSQIIDISYL